MTWRVYWDAFETAELTGGTVFQKVAPSKNLVLVGVRVWICVQDQGSLQLAGLKMRITSPSERLTLYESTNSFDKSDLFDGAPLWWKVREIFFEFDQVTLRKDEPYNFSMFAETYSPARSFGWRKAYPDPVYEAADYVPNQTTVARSPYAIYLIGDKL